MGSAITWIEVSSGRVFRVPADTQLPMGDAVLRNLKGERLAVALDALVPFEVPRDQALRQVTEDVTGFLGGLGEGLKGEAERLEPTVRELGGRLREGVNTAQVADALDGVGDRLKAWARSMRGGDGDGGTPAGRSPGPPEQRLCPACFALVVGTGPCASCELDLDAEPPIAMSPLQYAEIDRRDCSACAAPILVTARRCAACGASQGRRL